jgi:hypothetical protein
LKFPRFLYRGGRAESHRIGVLLLQITKPLLLLALLTHRLCRFIGVADLAAVRFSLPSQLLEPTPNLEYWNYLDSPNAFIAIGTSDDPVDRMLEVLRFWFTKDLKYAKGKPCKPYNSCLGEFFRVYTLSLRLPRMRWEKKPNTKDQCD